MPAQPAVFSARCQSRRNAKAASSPSGSLPGLFASSHERWDGRGYPDGLAGDQIPLGARVIQVCDAHDAMTRDRPYRPAMPAEVARAEIQSYAGAQFDRDVAAAFLEEVGEPTAHV